MSGRATINRERRPTDTGAQPHPVLAPLVFAYPHLRSHADVVAGASFSSPCQCSGHTGRQLDGLSLHRRDQSLVGGRIGIEFRRRQPVKPPDHANQGIAPKAQVLGGRTSVVGDPVAG